MVKWLNICRGYVFAGRTFTRVIYVPLGRESAKLLRGQRVDRKAWDEAFATVMVFGLAGGLVAGVIAWAGPATYWILYAILVWALAPGAVAMVRAWWAGRRYNAHQHKRFLREVDVDANPEAFASASVVAWILCILLTIALTVVDPLLNFT